ncbi:EAL domain-containing protein [Sulfurovum sp. CS9]|uniref:EAL domain-containing protein n=1 Tax=Sulfurovum sp. CS9 TaxID=3391146 RepID=UPI0039E7601C
MRNMKSFILFALLLFVAIGYKTYDEYHRIQETQKLIVLNESRSLSEFISAFRQTYQDFFLLYHIEVDENTINLLPVKTISEISNRFSSSVQGDVVIRTVSDRPRNPDNMANDFELEMIQYFKNNPETTDKFIQKEDVYYYTKPLLIQQSCLRCHGKREDAIQSIRDKYKNAYDYKLGEIRGLLNIKIKEREFFAAMYSDFTETLISAILLYIIFLLIIYVLIQKMHAKEEQYTKQLETDIATKTYEIKKQKDILFDQAHHDALTGLPNRVLFNDRLEHGIEQAKRHKTDIALFFIDLDHFKQINDSLGHQVGDKMLIAVTERLKAKIRKEDTLARLGGDEFTIIIEDMIEIQDVSHLAQKILEVLRQPVHIEGHTLYISCSIGISLYPQDDINANNLIKYADAAMYKAKEEGRNNFQFYSSEMTALALERVVMETNLRQALKNEEFILYYQSQVDANSGKLTGVEALIRWQHPALGLVSPMKFITLAEETGLIVDIDRWVMKTAMKQVTKWYQEGLEPGVLAINLSMRELRSNDFIEILQENMSDIGFKPEWLELEITEGQVMINPEEAITKLELISQMGIKIVIDDFGTGYSSLAYLKRLPVDKLKIDQSFVKGIPNDKEDVAIVKAIIALAKSLDLELIAEGVETDDQRDFLVECGCENLQGYYYCKPMPSDEMEKKCLGDL